MDPHSCPLCQSSVTRLFSTDQKRSYLRCADCQLTFVPPKFHLDANDEKTVYDQHENSPQDQRYRDFLNRLFAPVNSQIAAGSRGLDFGSGPGPTLSVMFEESGHTMEIYDLFYAPDASVLATTYDFVTASEVVEHFCNPQQDLQRLWSCVRPGGILGIMTKRATDAVVDFQRWHYTHDPTHVSFFARATFEWLANHWTAELNFEGNDVVLIRKQS